MKQFQLAAPQLTLDSCRPCCVVWFDAAEFEAIPEAALESPDELILRGREAMAVEKVKQIAERARSEDTMPEEEWKWLPAFLGMPVQLDEPGLARWPWLTWTLCGLIALVSMLAFFDLQNIIDLFGLVPAHAGRYGGFTFVSSFFLHAGFLHLIGNLYFLFVFGGNVEDYLGRARLGLLILLAALGGDALALAFDPRSDQPSIGASGGIAGVLAFYALEFPRARLAFLFGLAWLRVPAWIAFVGWILLQVVLASEQVLGESDISGLAHLGGAGVGFMGWLIWGNSMTLWRKPA